MFKTIESSWNSRTPSYLHPHTKENILWQLKLLGVFLVAMAAKDAYNERQLRKKYPDHD